MARAAELIATTTILFQANKQTMVSAAHSNNVVTLQKSRTAAVPVVTSMVQRKSFMIITLVLALAAMLFLHAPPVYSSTADTSRSTQAEANPIRQISILGERNSGTRWTFE